MILKTKEASKYIGVSINTLKTLANNERIKSFKTAGGHRRFMQEDLDCFTGKVTEKQDKVTVVYARCSTAKQKENLDRQKERLMRHAESQGYKYIVIDEIASGINEKRKGLHKLLNMAFQGKIERVLIEYKDRIARFGYEYLWSIIESCDREIDREALAILIMEINFESYGFSHEEVAYKITDRIISNMPTWLPKRNIL